MIYSQTNEMRVKSKIEYLGMVIEEGKISMDPGKLWGIQDWPTPTMVKQTQSFLGFGNFYWRFVRNFSNLEKPLNDLLKNDQKIEWTKAQQDTFDKLKKQFTEELVLMMPDHTKPFQICWFLRICWIPSALHWKSYRTSATNCARQYNHTLNLNDLEPLVGWQYGFGVTTEQVWDGFVLLALLEDCLQWLKGPTHRFTKRSVHSCTTTMQPLFLCPQPTWVKTLLPQVFTHL